MNRFNTRECRRWVTLDKYFFELKVGWIFTNGK